MSIKIKKHFSIGKKLALIFGCLIAVSLGTLTLFAVNTADVAIVKKVDTHLIDKANDTAALIDSRLTAFLRILEEIAHFPEIKNMSVLDHKKAEILLKERKFRKEILQLNFYGKEGQRKHKDGRTITVTDRQWFRSAISGKWFISDPLISKSLQRLVIIIAVPVYDDKMAIIGTLDAVIDVLWLTDQIKDIIVGKTGKCEILADDGTLIATEDSTLVTKRTNFIEAAKKNASFSSLAAFQSKAITSSAPATDVYEYNGILKICSYAKIKTTGWTVIIYAPQHEFMGVIQDLWVRMSTISIIIVFVSLIVVYIVARGMVAPVQNTVITLKNIADGDGDLTTRLPVKGNDEITDLARYFNKTIEKLGSSIRIIGEDSRDMENIGTELASSMREAAASVNQISTNIEGVKRQVITQASEVTETSATMEEIMRTIEQLNKRIERQAAHVADSSSSVEQMVANIAAVTGTLEKTDIAIQGLASKTREGSDVVKATTTDMQQIVEESGALQEAASVIQNIASQTNLLAMNAAIEAAHAGESGKGFAVVADEIRKLAEESSTQGKAISSSLKNLSTKIQEIAQSTMTVEEKFVAIYEVAKEVTLMSASLTSAMEEQERGSREVLTAMREINSITDEVKMGAAEMLQGGEQVAGEMRKLDDLTHTITNSMNAMATGAVQINNTVQEINEMSTKNKEHIAELADEVSKFKV